MKEPKLFDCVFWAMAALFMAFAITSLCKAQEFNDESYDARLERAVQNALGELTGRVGVVETRVDSLEQRVAGLEQNTPTPLGPGQTAPTSPVPATSHSAASVKINEADLPWQAKPTPRAEVIRILGTLKPRADETLVDFGCGFDARYLIEAVKRYGCRGIGVEIDHARAASARQYVAEAGLSDQIEIVEGDARTVEVNADVGVVYLEPGMLDELKPQLVKLNRFVSYQHAIPGLAMTKGQDAYYWQQSQAMTVASVTVSSGKRAVWDGQFYSGPLCTSPNCAMCNSIRSQLARSVVTTQVQQVRQVQPAKPQPVVTYQRTYTANCVGCRNCVNGNCQRPVRRFFRNVFN